MPNDQSQLNFMGATDISSATNSPLKEEIAPGHLKQIKPTKKPTDTQSQEPLPKAIHQTQSIIAQTITKSQRHFKDQTIPKPLASSSYNNTYQNAHTKSHYVKKNISQQACSKIILRTTSEPLKATTDSRLQEQIKHEDFPPLPNSRRQSQHQITLSQSQIDGHQTTQLLLLELLNRHNL